MNPYFNIVKDLLEENKWKKDDSDKRGYDIGWIITNKTKRYLGQDVSELPYLMSYLSNYKIKSWLEIGILDGASFYFWKEIVDKDCKFVGVDRNDIYPIDFLYPNQSFYFIKGDLNKDYRLILEKIKDINPKFDVVFIDDGHSFRDVKRDYTLFSSISKQLIIFHDYYSWSGVRKFVDNLNKNIEIIPNSGKVGWAIIKK